MVSLPTDTQVFLRVGIDRLFSASIKIDMPIKYPVPGRKNINNSTSYSLFDLLEGRGLSNIRKFKVESVLHMNHA